MTEQVAHKVWCAEHHYLARHVGIRQDGQTVYGWLEPAPGMVSHGKRTYGPSLTPRGRPRSSTPLMEKKPGAVTLHCLRCNAVQEVNVGPDTVLVWTPK